MPRLEAGMEVVIHSTHPFLRGWDGKKGTVVGIGIFNPKAIEVAVEGFNMTAEFFRKELEVVK